ncbi:hypothetical protein SBADM41S_11020 [Streptomyces badius]
MAKRADRLLAGLEAVRVSDKVAKLRFPEPAPCGKTPLMAEGLSKSYGSLEIFTDVDLAIDKGSRVVILGLNGAGKTTLLRLLGGAEKPDTGEIIQGHGLKLGYYAQEHETLDPERTVLENMRSAAPDLDLVEVRKTLGSFLFSGDDVDKPAGVLSGGEKTRLALATLVVSSRQRAAARRAHQQPRPRQPRGDPRRAAHLQGRRRPRHPRRGCRRGAPAGADHPAPGRRRGPLGGRLPRTSSPSPDPPGTLADPPGIDHSAYA